MVWAALATAAAQYASSESQRMDTGGGPAVMPSGPVTVSVGGLNVPAYPNFPRFQSGPGGMVSEQTAATVANTAASNGSLYLLAGGVVLAVFLVKFAK